MTRRVDRRGVCVYPVPHVSLEIIHALNHMEVLTWTLYVTGANAYALA